MKFKIKQNASDLNEPVCLSVSLSRGKRACMQAVDSLEYLNNSLFTRQIISMQDIRYVSD